MLQKEVKELCWAKEKVTTATAQEIEALKKAQEELKMKVAKEITELKKETDCLIIEKAELFASHKEMEEAVTDSCQHILESTIELDVVEKERDLGKLLHS